MEDFPGTTMNPAAMNVLTRTRGGILALASSMAEVREGKPLTRSYTVGAINEKERTVELAFSSDAEIPRWGDIEILSHAPGAVDMRRMVDGASLLFNHNLNDVIGVVVSASIDSDGKGRALVRFSKSARGEAVWQDVKDGILKHVSVGYRVHEMELTEKRGGTFVYTVTKWEPYEVSIVTVPVDTSVGVNRNLNPEKKSLMTLEEMKAYLATRGVQVAADATEAEVKALFQRSIVPAPQPAPLPVGAPAPAPAVTVPPVITHQSRGETPEDERTRQRSIKDLGVKYKMPDEALRAIGDGVSTDEFQRTVLAELDKRNSAMTDSQRGLDLSEGEVAQFSFTRLLRSMSDPQDSRAREAAKFELEVCTAAAAKKDNVRGFVIPADILRQPLRQRGTDTISIKSGSGYTGDGGNTVQTTLLTSSFIELLRKRTVLMRRGTVLTGLVGNFDIPKQTEGTAGYWIGEDEAATKSDVAFGMIGLRPHTVASLAEITRRMLMQSSLDVEALVRADLAKGIAEAIDYAGFYGDGTGNMPIGLLASNPNAVDFAGLFPTYAELVAMETEIAEVDIDPSGSAYIARSNFRGHCKTTQRFAGGGDTGTIWEAGGTVNGYGTEITNQIENGDVFFGDWSQFLIGMWGGLELTVDPYTHSDKGRIRLVAMQDVDFEARRPDAFTYGSQTAGS